MGGGGRGNAPLPRSSLEKPARLRETPSTVRDSGFGFVLSHPFAPSVRQRPDPLGLPIAHLQQLPSLATGYSGHIVENGPVSTSPSTDASYAQHRWSSL